MAGVKGIRMVRRGRVGRTHRRGLGRLKSPQQALSGGKQVGGAKKVRKNTKPRKVEGMKRGHNASSGRAIRSRLHEEESSASDETQLQPNRLLPDLIA